MKELSIDFSAVELLGRTMFSLLKNNSFCCGTLLRISWNAGRFITGTVITGINWIPL